MNIIQRILRKILAVATWNPSLTIVVAVAMAALSILYTYRNLGFQTSQRDLISPQHRLIKLVNEVEEFDDFDRFVIVIENRDTERSLEFLRALVPVLRADRKHYAEIFERVDPDSFRRWALLYLDEKELVSLRNSLEEHHGFIRNLAESPDLNNFFRQLNREITAAMVGELFTGFLEDDQSGGEENPFDLTFLIKTLQSMKNVLDGGKYRSPWGSLFSGEEWDEKTEGYFWTENKQYLLIFVTPKKIDGGFSQTQSSLNALRSAIAEVRKGFPDVNVGVTGQEALNMDEMTSAFHDMSLATVISLVGLMSLLTLFWRGVRRPLFEMTELLIALSLTFGLTTLLIGHLNILSIVFAPLLLGLGIDYGIHWLARYQEEEWSSDATRKENIQRAMVKIGPGIILAGFTAALSFFPLVLTGFKGLVELGIISSMGMVMTTFTTLFVLPALTLKFDKPVKRKKNGFNYGKPLFCMTNRRAVWILVISGIGLGISLVLASGVRFDLNMLKLQSKGAESVIWETKLLEGSGHSSMYGAVLANSREEVKRKTEALEALATVSEVQSVETLLPEHQSEKMKILSQLKPLLPEMNLFQPARQKVDLADLEKSLSRIRFKMLDTSKSKWGARAPIEGQMTEVRNLITEIRDRLQNPDGFSTADSMAKNAHLQSLLHSFQRHLMADMSDKLDLLHANANNTSPMRLSDLPANLLERFVSKDGRFLIRVFPAVDVWEPEYLGKFVEDMQSVDPDAIGDPVTLYVFTKAFRDACIKAAVFATIFIALLLAVMFRSLVDMLLAVSPLLVGTAWTMGVMRCFGVNLNLANSLFLPLIVGAGVEYGIIILQRWKQRESDDDGLAFSTGKGIILAGLTTTVGFGSLTVAAHQGINSLGVLATIGSLCVVLAAVLFLPALLRLRVMAGRKWNPQAMGLPSERIGKKCARLKEEQI